MDHIPERTGRSRLVKLTALVILVLLTIALVEVMGQLYYRWSRGRWLWREEEFKTNVYVPYTIPVSDRREFALRPGFKDEITTIDEHGFRATVPEPRAGERVVVNLGDSVPFGAGAANADTYSSRLAKLFRERNILLGVINAGVSSYNTRQSFDRLRIDVGRYYKPSEIAAVTFTAANDISQVFYFAASYTPDTTWARARNLVPLRPAWQQLATGHYVSTVFDTYRHRPIVSAAATTSTNRSPEEVMLEGVRSDMREQLAYWNQHHVLIVLTPFNPFYYQLAHQEKNADLRVLREVYKNNLKEMPEWDGLIRRYNDVLRAVAAEFPNARYLETRAIFDEEDRNLIYGDYAHFVPNGHQRMAEVLYDYLKEQHVIDQSR